MNVKNRILSFVLAVFVLSSAVMTPPLILRVSAEEAETMPPDGDAAAGSPFEPDDLNGINGITYELHTGGIEKLTDETVAVLEIKPNKGARLLSGTPDYGSIQGYRTVGEMAGSYTEQGYDVIAAINGSFFGVSNQPGTQVMNQGVFIRHGELLRNWGPQNSNEYISQEHYIIGTLKNGEFFHGHNPLHSMQMRVDRVDVANGGETRTLQNLNGPRSTGNPGWRDLTLLTERFGEFVPSAPEKLAGTDVGLEIIEGRVAFGEELVMRVIQPPHPAEDNAPIGKGRAILTAANAGDTAFLESLKAGDIVTVSHDFTNRRGTSVDWSQVDQAIPAHFLLIKGGAPQPLPGQPGALLPVYPEITPNPETGSPLPLLPSQNAKRPRTGIGLRADGTMVWVVVSGGGNAGMTMGEFQDYLISLGLEYAWNFDGGASSAMVIGEMPVTYAFGPESDLQRPVANGLVLVSPPLPDNTVEITVQPRPQKSQIAQGDASGRLYVRARSTAGELNFQWYQNGEPVGANSPVFEIPPDLELGEYEFYAVISAGTVPPQISNKASVTVIEPPIPFIDVQDGDWFAGDVMFTYKNGLMSGTSADPVTFSPNMTLTRGMLVTTLYRYSGCPDVSNFANPFGDVAAGLWYSDAVIWAAHNGIVQGVGGNLFAPEQNITREQIAVIMLRYAGAANKILPEIYQAAAFADGRAISDWADEAVMAIRGAGIIFGRPGNLFDPQGIATRAEASAILRRFAECAI